MRDKMASQNDKIHVLKDSRGVPFGYNSVTEILSPFSKLHLIDSEILKNACDRGTKVHNYCHMYAENLLLVDPEPEYRGYVNSYKKWYDTYVVKPIYMETRLNCEENKLSGEFDLLAILDNDKQPSIIDIKTPAAISKSWSLQTAAYQMLVESELKETVFRRIVVILPKNGGPAQMFEHYNYEKDKELFLKALELYRYFN